MAITSWGEWDQWNALVRGRDDPLTDLVTALTRRPAWHQQAACRGHGTAQWFPENGGDTRQARAVCATCPVAGPCLAAALADPACDGIWSSTSQRQRQRLRADRQRASA